MTDQEQEGHEDGTDKRVVEIDCESKTAPLYSKTLGHGWAIDDLTLTFRGLCEEPVALRLRDCMLSMDHGQNTFAGEDGWLRHEPNGRQVIMIKGLRSDLPPDGDSVLVQTNIDAGFRESRSRPLKDGESRIDTACLRIGRREMPTGRRHLVLMTEDGRILEGQRSAVIKDNATEAKTITVEFVIDGDDVYFEDDESFV